MLVTLLAWIYITTLCFCWGGLFFTLIKFKKATSHINEVFFYVQCISGMGVIASLLTIATFFTHLYNPWLHLLFIVPCFFYLAHQKPGIILNSIKERYGNLLWPLKWLLVALLLFILVMSVYQVNHPDTVRYHVQIIKWLGYYKITPGTVHFDKHLGLQSNWFTVCSFFSFPFMGLKALTFMNTTLLTWLFGFIISKINRYVKNGNKLTGESSLLFIFFLAIAVYNYTQIRLTATSPSPDFPAALFILLVGYLFLQLPSDATKKVLILFLCLFAYTIKPSALPVLLLIPFLFFNGKHKKTLLFYGFSCFIMVIAPFLLRNTITSGHPFYPYAINKMRIFDWSLDYEKCNDFRDYILGYARVCDDDSKNTAAILQFPFKKWIKIWWKQQPGGNKLLLVSLLISILLFSAAILNGKKLNYNQRCVFFISLVAIVFWFTNAPDPRFGMGFILLFQALAYRITLEHYGLPAFFTTAKSIRFFINSLTVIVLLYSGYRAINYFTIKNLLQPSGVLVIPPTKTIPLKKGILVNAVSTETDCGDVQPPCLSGSSYPLEARGSNIQEGFKSKDQ